METFPKYYLIHRKWIGHINTTKKVLDSIASASVFTQYPWLAAVCIALRAGLSYAASISYALEPIIVEGVNLTNVNEKQITS